MNTSTPTENKTPEHMIYQPFDYMQLEQFEREARRLRAQVFAKGLGMLGQYFVKTSQKLAKSVQSGFSYMTKNGLNTEINGKPGRLA